MSRIATIPLQMLQSDSIGRAQERLAAAQTRLATGRKAESFAGLGTDAAVSLSGRSVIAAQEGYASVSQRLQTQLSLVNSNLESMDAAGTDLRNALVRAVGTGEAPGLEEAIQLAFGQFRAAVNASGEKGHLFAGGGKGAPFAASTLSDLDGVDVTTLFRNGEARATARVADGVNLEHGLVATDIGVGLAQAFRTLAEAGPFGERPTPAQMAALTEAVGQFQTGLQAVREHSSANGRRQAQLEQFESQAIQRKTDMEELVGKAEDADLGRVAVEITQQQAVLEASYGVLARLSRLSLLNYLD
jgi:flagellar hook-associated protein 3 FlgL